MPRGGFLQRVQDAGSGSSGPDALGFHAAAHVDGETGTFIGTPFGFSAVTRNDFGDYTLDFAAGFEILPSKAAFAFGFDLIPIYIGAGFILPAGTQMQVFVDDRLGASVDAGFYVAVWRYA